MRLPDGDLIHKSTLTSLLDESPTHFSHDRLHRVRQRVHKPHESIPTRSTEHSINLYDDYAVFKKEENKFIMAKLQCMRKKGSRAYVKYSNPVKFDDPDVRLIETVFKIYSDVKEEPTKFSFGDSSLFVRKASEIIFCLDLTYSAEEKSYTIAPEALQLVSRSMQA